MAANTTCDSCGNVIRDNRYVQIYAIAFGGVRTKIRKRTDLCPKCVREVELRMDAKATLMELPHGMYRE